GPLPVLDVARNHSNAPLTPHISRPAEAKPQQAMQARLSPVRALQRVVSPPPLAAKHSAPLHHAAKTFKTAGVLKPASGSFAVSRPRSFHSSPRLGLLRDDTKDCGGAKEHHPFAFAFELVPTYPAQ